MWHFFYFTLDARTALCSIHTVLPDATKLSFVVSRPRCKLDSRRLKTVVSPIGNLKSEHIRSKLSTSPTRQISFVVSGREVWIRQEFSTHILFRRVCSHWSPDTTAVQFSSVRMLRTELNGSRRETRYNPSHVTDNFALIKRPARRACQPYTWAGRSGKFEYTVLDSVHCRYRH